MTIQAQTGPDVRRALVWGALLAGLWVVPALIRPTATYHLAPLLVASTPSVFFGLDNPDRPDRATALRIGAGSIVMALAALGVLAAIGAMQGPAFEAFPSPLVEAVVFSVIGSVAGVGFAVMRTR